MKKKICIMGQFPPPMHGLSKALETLYNSNLNHKYDLLKVNLTNNKEILRNLHVIRKSDCDLYYLTIAQSKFGNIRDLIIIKLILLKKKKIILHLHGGGFRQLIDNEFGFVLKKLNYSILKKTDGAIVLGESLKYIFKDIVDENKILIVKNCVDNQFVLDDLAVKEKLNQFISKREVKILYLSNFIKDKGYEEVLTLAKYVHEKQDDRFKFVFAGKFFNSQDEEEFFKYINDNNLNDIVSYKGIVKGEEKTQLIKECDYFILLTRYKNEGQPISIIEAAVNGVRIITTNHAGIKDILDDEKMIIVDKNNISVEKIYNLISKEYDSREEISNTCINNRSIILKEFSEEEYIRRIDEIFSSIK